MGTGMDASREELDASSLPDTRPVREPDAPISGTCGALARRLDTDPVALRVVTVFAGLTAGFGVGAYAAAWLLWPSSSGMSPLERVVPAIKHWSSSTRVALIVAGGCLSVLLLSTFAPFDLVALLLAAGYIAWARRQAMPVPTSRPRRTVSAALSATTLIAAGATGALVWRAVSPDSGAFLASASASLLVASAGLLVSAFTRKTRGVWTFATVCALALAPALALQAQPPAPETMTYAHMAADDDAVVVGKNATIDLTSLPEDRRDPFVVICLYGHARVILPEDVDATVSYSTLLSHVRLPGKPVSSAAASWDVQKTELPRVLIVAAASEVEVVR